jgi:deazaflavin-dependent oxidoreductase (nitroreductase family)
LGTGFPSLVLTTVGAKSVTPRHTPVAYFPDDADSWLIVASAAGAAKNPDCYYNLAAHPDNDFRLPWTNSWGPVNRRRPRDRPGWKRSNALEPGVAAATRIEATTAKIGPAKVEAATRVVIAPKG